MPSVNIQSPITQRFYPKISEIFNLDNLPEAVSFLKKDLEVLLNKVYYKNLQVSKSGKGEYSSFEVDLIFQREIGLDLFAGIKLLLNSGTLDDSFTIPVSIDLHWEIVKYVRNFKSKKFSESSIELLKIGLEIFKLKEEDLLALVLANFIVEQDNSSRFQVLISDVNTNFNTNLSLSDTN